MKRFKNILYLLDQRTIGEGSSGDRVASLARINEARVTPLIVHESGLLENISSKLSKRFDEAQHIMREQRQQAFNLFLQQRYWQDIAIGQEYLEFDNFIPVIQKVIKDGHDLVIKEESLESGVDQLAMRLVRKCPCPVWVMKSGAKTFNHVLAAVDISADHPESQSLNKKIV
ncbi:MAG: universal stress protein, partial [Desulfobulbaceae bacterium]